MKAIADLKFTLAETENSLGLAKMQASDLTQDQTRLRADIDSLNRVKGQEDQVRKYSAQLADNEVELAKNPRPPPRSRTSQDRLGSWGAESG
ncbi:MAG: hypothetical protein WB676_14290 [Bryobacteraceae bacterium]